jgi:hypothetical protein
MVKPGSIYSISEIISEKLKKIVIWRYLLKSRIKNGYRVLRHAIAGFEPSLAVPLSQVGGLFYLGRRCRMKKLFWNVQIEMYDDGTVRAAILRTRMAIAMPRDGYVRNPGREVFSLWFKAEVEAQGAVLEALAMNKGQETAA